MSNFFILEDGPMASPGNCLICGYSGSDRKFTDPRKDFDEYGSVILCELCVIAMAEDYGLISPTQVRVLMARIKEAESELVILRQAVSHVENLNVAISDLNSLRNAISDGSVGLSSDAGSPEVADDPISDDEPDIVGMSQGEFALSLGYSESRSDDVSDVTDESGYATIKL